jgi:hypothetical protein
MSGTPKFKVYREGEYIGALKYAEDAAAVVSLAGSLIKYDHGKTIWREGHEEVSAGESYDRAAAIMLNRIHERGQP